MIIRLTELADCPSVLAVVGAAMREQEKALVKQIWKSPEYLPELDLVAEDEGVVGHILHSIAHIDDRDVVALGPVGVVPARQRQGIGTALVEEALRRADEAGFPLIVLLGHPSYYPRFGFVPARSIGIEPPIEIKPGPDPFMAKPLSSYDPSYRGQFRYCSAFDEVPEES